VPTIDALATKKPIVGGLAVARFVIAITRTLPPEAKIIVTPFFELTIGAFDYQDVFKEKTLLAYSALTSVAEGNEHDTSRGFIHELSHFAKIAWLSRDHAIRTGNGYLWANGRIFLDYPEGLAWKSDGSQDDIELTRIGFRDLRKHHLDDWRPIRPGELIATPTKERSTRLFRALHYVFNAMCSQECIDKIVNYCSALEALFATSHSELVHLLSERTAIAVSRNAEERHAAYHHVRDCYRLRSAYTHGSVLRQKDLDPLPIMSVKLDELVRKCTNRAMDGELAEAISSDKTLDEWFLKGLFA
jgi:hypothetical protein